ncbi:hypothetical protein F4806DRAFT_69860 [Annulohypoxylon nitens]|nr:hypothetical protein F4806DRAFT_69860 [Annulohypoxylon nitens]
MPSRHQQWCLSHLQTASLPRKHSTPLKIQFRRTLKPTMAVSDSEFKPFAFFSNLGTQDVEISSLFKSLHVGSDLYQVKCPDCPCGYAVVRKCGKSNVNGNAKRPFFACEKCGTFVSFADDRGLDPENPKCHCGNPTRCLITSTQGKGGWNEWGKLHFRCRIGRCNFFAWDEDDEGDIRKADNERVLADFIEKGFV